MYGIFGRYPLEPPFLNNLGMGYGFTNAPSPKAQRSSPSGIPIKEKEFTPSKSQNRFTTAGYIFRNKIKPSKVNDPTTRPLTKASMSRSWRILTITLARTAKLNRAAY